MLINKATLAIMGVALSISACVPTETYVSESDITQVTIKGKELAVPIKVNEILNLGFTLDAVSTNTLSPNDDCIGYFKSDTGETLIANIGTLDSNVQNPEDGYAFDVLEDVIESVGTGALEVYGDITIASSVEDVIKVYGEPVYDDGINQLYHKIIEDKYDSAIVYVAVTDGSIQRVEVCNPKGFKYPEATASDIVE